MTQKNKCLHILLCGDWELAQQIKLKSQLVLKFFLYQLVVGEETKHVGPCGTCGAIRVEAVSALFAPNAKRGVKGAQGVFSFYDEMDGGW